MGTQVREETAVELIIEDNLINTEARDAPIPILALFSRLSIGHFDAQVLHNECFSM